MKECGDRDHPSEAAGCTDGPGCEVAVSYDDAMGTGATVTSETGVVGSPLHAVTRPEVMERVLEMYAEALRAAVVDGSVGVVFVTPVRPA